MIVLLHSVTVSILRLFIKRTLENTRSSLKKFTEMAPQEATVIRNGDYFPKTHIIHYLYIKTNYP